MEISPGASVKVGRFLRADLAIPDDEYLSGVHFLLTNDGRSASITDLKSSNGLYLNGVRVLTAILDQSANISAGRSSFTVEFHANEYSTAVLKPDGLDEIQFEVLSCLCRQPDSLFAVVDAAHGDTVLTLILESDSEHECLYDGRAAQ